MFKSTRWRGLCLSVVMVLSACSPAPALTPVPTATPVVVQPMKGALAAALVPTVAGYQAGIDARGLAMLEGPMVIRLSEFDTLTINVPVPVSASVELVPPASGRALSRSAQCPAPGNPVISLVSQGKVLEQTQAYLDGGGSVADLEKLLNSRLDIQNGHAQMRDGSLRCETHEMFVG